MKRYGWKDVLFRTFPSFGANVDERLHTFLALLPQKEALFQFRKYLGSSAAGLDALEKRIFALLSKFELQPFFFLVIGTLTEVPRLRVC